jgi:hypothetical protein
MRRARFYLTLLALTLMPQVLAATDLVRWLQAHDVTWLSFSVSGLLLLLNAPMMFEVLRRKQRARLPRALAAAVRTPWTAWWLGSLFYALLLLFWGTERGSCSFPTCTPAGTSARSGCGTSRTARRGSSRTSWW